MSKYVDSLLQIMARYQNTWKTPDELIRELPPSEQRGTPEEYQRAISQIVYSVRGVYQDALGSIMATEWSGSSAHRDRILAPLLETGRDLMMFSSTKFHEHNPMYNPVKLDRLLNDANVKKVLWWDWKWLETPEFMVDELWQQLTCVKDKEPGVLGSSSYGFKFTIFHLYHLVHLESPNKIWLLDHLVAPGFSQGVNPRQVIVLSLEMIRALGIMGDGREF